MSAPDRDPLSSEERELAAHLQRLGGPDGPPAALDARILAAARAAAVPPAPRHASRRPRFATWLPGGAITAVGTAAALVLAIGTAWQLRPVDRPAVQRPAIADDGAVAFELLGPREKAVPPSATDEASAEVSAPRPPVPAAAPRASTSDSTTERRVAASDAAEPTAGTRTAASAAPAAAESDLPASETASTAITAPRSALPDAVERDAATPQSAVPVDASGPRRRATYTTAARARAESDDRPRDAATRARPDDRDAIDLAMIPVRADADLSPAEWLERIRARRDAGDVDAARESLQRFMRAHPRVRPPSDLRELAQ